MVIIIVIIIVIMVGGRREGSFKAEVPHRRAKAGDVKGAQGVVLKPVDYLYRDSEIA